MIPCDDVVDKAAPCDQRLPGWTLRVARKLNRIQFEYNNFSTSKEHTNVIKVFPEASTSMEGYGPFSASTFIFIFQELFYLLGPIRSSKFNFLQRQLLNYQRGWKRHHFIYSRLS